MLICGGVDTPTQTPISMVVSGFQHGGIIPYETPGLPCTQRVASLSHSHTCTTSLADSIAGGPLSAKDSDFTQISNSGMGWRFSWKVVNLFLIFKSCKEGPSSALYTWTAWPVVINDLTKPAGYASNFHTHHWESMGTSFNS